MYLDRCISLLFHRLRRGLLFLPLLFPAFPVIAESTLDEARALFRQGQPEQALKRLDALSEEAASEVGARLLRGVLQAELRRMEAAIDTFESLSRDYPHLPQPLNNLAVIYAGQGMVEQARNTLLRTIRLQPRHANAHHNLGDLYIRMALEAYARAYGLNPENASLNQKLTLAKNLVGGETDYARADAAGHGDQDAPTQATTVASDDADRCLVVGPVQGRAVRNWLKRQGLAAIPVRREKPLGVIYQVYLEPLGKFAKTKRRIAELKRQGVSVAAAIYTGALRTGISLGAFQTEARAKKLVRELKAKGITARFRTQNPVREETGLTLRDAPDTDRRKALATQFPNLRMRTEGC